MNAYIKIYAILLMMIIECLRGEGTIADDNPIQSDVAKIHEKFADLTIRQIEIVHIPATVVTRIPVTPESLEKDFWYKVTMRRRPGCKIEKGLGDALKSLKVRPSGEAIDLRWGIVFFDDDMHRIGDIYFGGTGDRCLVDSISVSCNNDLFDWLNSTFSCFVESKSKK